MQRHGYKQVGAVQYIAAGAYHPTREERHRFEAIAVFEAEDEIAARVVVGERGARQSKRRRSRDAGRAFYAFTQIVRKRKAALCAVRRRQETQFRPALAAGRLRLGHRRAALEAERRQDEIERSAAGRSSKACEAGGGQIHRPIMTGAWLACQT